LVSLERFNFETMSGVYPGTRTQVFQRVLLQRTDATAGEGALTQYESTQYAPTDALPANPSTWALIYWYEDPAACVVRIEGDETPLRVETTRSGDGLETLQKALAERGWEPYVCGACHHWQSGAGSTVDGLPLGKCGLARQWDLSGEPAEEPAVESIEIPLLLGAQSSLALGCPHWSRSVATGATESAGSEEAKEQGKEAAALPMHPLPKIAEISESKMKPLRRWQVRLKRWLAPPPPAPTLDDHLVERSGVGAGTEPCPCCQGRIANLGALAVQDEATDKQTLSVWRCRLCHALFLSDWIDRWERVDSLETEETIYRIAPIEAAEMLTLIASVQEAEHPRRRSERTAEREWILAQVAGREPVSHVIKQGR